MSTYSTVNYGELTESIQAMTSVSDALAVLGEVSSPQASMTQVANALYTFSEYGQTDSESYELDEQLSAEVDSNVIDYSITVAGMWDWKFSLTSWNNIGNTWDDSWKVINQAGESD
ncbi:MAG: hypothetical protein CMI54_00710 [Parcubacteria group bacterium]|jgi:hypothetical protein|nr:hypothetical protein [Parcubacteria group bacterium]|tara:strand:- start:1094 stop:1441 length:348 start_codon:yes stop_codon:yes gene_type:complete